MSDTTDTPITDEAWGKPYTRQDQRLHTMRRTCCDLERQLAEATAQYGRSLDELMTERDTAIEQRDRLAEAVAKIRLFVTESKESADYWFNASECQCVSPQPIGSCLACDMAGISLGAEEALVTLERKEAE